MKRISAILLAAGESRRMGETNKLTLPVNGQALLQRTASQLLRMGLEELIVVTGHEAETARELLNGYPLQLVFNEHYREGQMTSVHRGLAALQLPCDGVFVCLTDLPLLETDDLQVIIDAFDVNDGKVVVPTFDGQRGNPILLNRSNVQAILSGSRNLGCKKLIENNPELVNVVEMPNDNVIFDLDTPEAYERLLSRLGLGPVTVQPTNLLQGQSHG